MVGQHSDDSNGLTPPSDTAPASATIKLNGVANTQVTHAGMKVTSEVSGLVADETYTCEFTWTGGGAADGASSSTVSTTVKANVVCESYISYLPLGLLLIFLNLYNQCFCQLTDISGSHPRGGGSHHPGRVSNLGLRS